MKTRMLLSTLTLAVALIGFAAPASASVFCAPDTTFSGCPQGAIDALGVGAGSIESAMSVDGSDGAPDTVYIAPGTFADPDSFKAAGSDDLTLIGAGRDQTMLTSSTSTNSYVLDLITGNFRKITVKNLAVVVPESFPNGPGYGAAVQSRGDDFESVDLINENPGGSSGSSGFAYIGSGGKFDDIRVLGRNGARFSRAFDGGSCNPGDAGLIAIDRVDVSGSTIGINASCPEISFEVSRSTFSGVDWPLSVSQGAKVRATNILIESGDFYPVDVYNSTGDGATKVDIDHATIVATGDATKPAIRAQVGSSSTADDPTEVTLTNSIVVGFEKAYELVAPVSPVRGDVTFTASYSDLTFSGPALGTAVGDSTFNQSNLINENPGFAGLTDYHLTLDSPAVDSGDPASTTGLDLEGNARPLDGNYDGTALTDMGAYELNPPPASCPADPSVCPDKTAPKLTKVKFRFRSGKGGALRFRVSEAATIRIVIRPVPKKGRKSVKITRTTGKARGVAIKLGKRRLKPGRYILRMVAKDPAGNTSKPVIRKIRVRRG